MARCVWLVGGRSRWSSTPPAVPHPKPPPTPLLYPTPTPPRQAPVGVSRYNDDYFCTVLAVQRPAGGGGGVGVRFAVICDGSLGSLQASPGPARPVQQARREQKVIACKVVKRSEGIKRVGKW